ncbi:hypothetical protein KY360_06550 [Candidatus Woesearchaeota archaeon]|nr:hypothetical protein [Candidatus Woesearchaeota archaeon]
MAEEKLKRIESDTAKVFRLNREAEELMAAGKEDEAKAKLEEAKRILREMFSLERFEETEIKKEEFNVEQHLEAYLEDLARRAEAAKAYVRKSKKRIP